MAAHGHKAMEVLGKAFICFFVQSGESAKALPMELHGVRVILHTKGRHHSIKISLFTPCPSNKGKRKQATVIRIQGNRLLLSVA